MDNFPDSKVHGANMGPIWGRQDPGGPHVGPMNFAICVTFELYGYFRCLQVFIQSKITFTKYCLTQWISNLSGSFEIYWVRQYLENFMGIASIVNTILYKTEPIFTGLQ